MSMIKVQRNNKEKENLIILGDIRGPLRGFRIITSHEQMNSKLSEDFEAMLNEVANRAYEEGRKDVKTEMEQFWSSEQQKE